MSANSPALPHCVALLLRSNADCIQPSFQVIAFLIEETGEYGERELNHSDGEAERFYRGLHQGGMHVRVGMEATGFSRWFERLLAKLDFELWIGDPAEIKAKRVHSGRSKPAAKLKT